MKYFTLFIILTVLVGCNQLASIDQKLIGKWKLTKPVTVEKPLTLSQLNLEFTENGNVIISVTLSYFGKTISEVVDHTKYQIDGNKILCENGSIYHLTENGELTNVTTLKSLPHKKIQVSLKKIE